MIKSFKNKEALAVYNHIYVKSLPTEVAKIGLRKLILIDNAANLNDLRIPSLNQRRLYEKYIFKNSSTNYR